MTEVVSSEAVGKSGDTAVTVSRQVSHPLKSVWNVLMTNEGAEALLGPGAHLGSKGQSWAANDGTRGVTRSFHPMEQIRFSWHASDDAPATLVDLHLQASGDDATDLQIVHDHLPADADLEQLAQHWQDALQRIDHDAL